MKLASPLAVILLLAAGACSCGEERVLERSPGWPRIYPPYLGSPPELSRKARSSCAAARPARFAPIVEAQGP